MGIEMVAETVVPDIDLHTAVYQNMKTFCLLDFYYGFNFLSE